MDAGPAQISGWSWVNLLPVVLSSTSGKGVLPTAAAGLWEYASTFGKPVFFARQNKHARTRMTAAVALATPSSTTEELAAAGVAGAESTHPPSPPLQSALLVGHAAPVPLGSVVVAHARAAALSQTAVHALQLPLQSRVKAHWPSPGRQSVFTGHARPLPDCATDTSSVRALATGQALVHALSPAKQSAFAAHASSAGAQSAAVLGQALPVPDCAVVAVKERAAASSQAAVHRLQPPAQSVFIGQSPTPAMHAGAVVGHTLPLPLCETEVVHARFAEASHAAVQADQEPVQSSWTTATALEGAAVMTRLALETAALLFTAVFSATPKLDGLKFAPAVLAAAALA